MEITHGIALFFVVVFVVLGAVFKKMLWWLVCIGTIFSVSFVAILNSWELILFAPLAIFGILSIIGFFYSALEGEWF